MAKGSPENGESKYQKLEFLAQQSKERFFYNMALTGIGMFGLMADALYLSEYYPINKTMEEIMTGSIDKYTEQALTASLGIFGFEMFLLAGVLAVSYRGFQSLRYSRQADIEKQSKRPPTLGS